MPSRKGFLISSFIRKNAILTFLESVHNQFSIPYSKIFIYNIDGNAYEYLVTFKVNEKIDLRGILSSSIIVHVKNHCIFSINALNRLIEKEAGNVENNKDYEINWNKYGDKMLIVINGELRIEKLIKIDDYCAFFDK